MNILIFEKQFLIKEGILSSLKKNNGFKLFCVENTTNLISEYESTTYDLLIIDYSTLGNEGNQFIKELKKRFSTIKILLLVDSIQYHEIGNLGNCGIFTIISKSIDEKGFFNAINLTVENKVFYSSDLVELIISSKQVLLDKSLKELISVSEMNILSLMISGVKPRDIAKFKNISYHTVVAHKKNLFKKLNVKSTYELINKALKMGIINNTI